MNEAILVRNGQEGNTGIIWPQTGVGRTVAGLVMIWFAIAVASVITGLFEYSAGQPPVNILIAILGPIALFGIGYYTISTFRGWVLSLDIRHLVLIHSMRMVGMGFVFLYFQDRLPALFALPAGIGDAMAAVGALFLGIALYEGGKAVSNRRIFLWNTFGLLDFIIAVSMGVLTRTGEVLYLEGQAGSDIMSIFPLGVVPGFFVPFYIITHLIIYVQLNRR